MRALRRKVHDDEEDMSRALVLQPRVAISYEYREMFRSSLQGFRAGCGEGRPGKLPGLFHASMICFARIRGTENNMPTRQSSAPKTGQDAVTVRLSRDLLKRIDRWIASQHSPLSRPEAIRQLAEFALDRARMSSKAGKSNQSADQAAGMASDMIDSLADRSATHEDREHRKKRLLKGPPEFREMRKKTGDARRKR
jgi:hypothetical protein